MATTALPSPSSSPDRGLRAAALLGLAGGMRTTAPLAGLVAADRLVGGAGRVAVLGATAAELGVDKHPDTPARTDPAGLGGRLGSSALAGHTVAGRAGALTALAAAGVSTFASYGARAALVARTDLPDAAVAVAEDALALGTAVLGARLAPAPTEAERTEPRPRPADALLRGVVASAAGTAAMTGAQLLTYRLSDAEMSDAPAKVGQRISRTLLHRRVPRRRRDQLNQGMHWLYGTSWGIPFGLAAGGRATPGSAPVQGAAFGLAVWGAGLVELPALGLSPPVWRQRPAAVARDGGLHLVYGLTAGLVLRVLRRG